ncbi:poly(ADP-ribose) glycohydrolase ARH3-like isoform X2 [Eurytemora carolleeae]|uniref:poly(ADP-ribose) glycohydrolase ARH3-like isoform X2 n=1 Tax=Eurytemora carolleeae TaxID=1294199 RepID=UPI000C7893B5|nr:poly(ADP-ribose) glycohydrolase ARH3-like isoform X2 [Eurytemora carolleeae]|eukprot:XP_023324703.1 poly(ADP-ribose) glycohydrolase ARH3-like isoform X2 [Eurytemora affinis]
MAKMLEHFKGCMVGGLIGDCLGAKFECQYENLVPVEKVDNFLKEIQDPTFSQKFTDDTAMARQIARSFIEKKSFNYQDLARRFSSEYCREPWRGYGQAVGEVFKALELDSTDPFKPGAQQFNGSGSYGNGAGMRAHPAALALHGQDTKKIIDTAVNIGRITHAHVLGVGGGVLQTLAVTQALKGGTPEDILSGVRVGMQEFEKEWENTEYSLKLDLVQEYMDQPDSELPEICFELGNDVSAIDSVPTAFFCFLRGCKRFQGKDQFEQTIRLAIHLGGDTDTIASMAGAITGAYLGVQSIPLYMKKHCEGLEDAEKQAEDIFGVVSSNLETLSSSSNGDLPKLSSASQEKLQRLEETEPSNKRQKV